MAAATSPMRRRRSKVMVQLFFDRNNSALSGPEDVKWLLAEPEKQWVPRYSAYETAYSWFDANGLPDTIHEILRTDPVFIDAELERAYFEWQTQLDDSGRGPSQTDVLALLKIKSGSAVIGVEGKVNEPFGQIVSDWNDYSPGKLRRLAGLIDQLNLKPSMLVGSLRYQLFHRTVATLLEAKKIGAAEAAVVVQSFSPDRRGFDDFQDFAAALGVPIAEPQRFSKPIQLGSVRLRLGWTVNSVRSVERP